MSQHWGKLTEITQTPVHLPQLARVPSSLASHHDLDLALADLEIVLVVDIHPLQSDADPLVCPHQEDDGKTPCGGIRCTH